MDIKLADTIQQGLGLDELWHGLRTGGLVVTETSYRDGRCYATLEIGGDERRPPAENDAVVLERVLAGEAQKVVALDLGVSTPTISCTCARVLRAVTNEHAASRTPILLVMAALAARGWSLAPAHFEHPSGQSGWVVSCPMPGHRLLLRLSPCEREVAKMAIEGKTHAQIARERRTSHRTVANQLSTIFRKLGVSGRASLRAKAVLEQSRELTATRSAGSPPPSQSRFDSASPD